jgi:uncharacterized membrane protein YcaP (DUF421 family)
VARHVLVALLTLSNTMRNAIIGENNSVTGVLIGAAALMAANYLLVRFIFKRRRLDQSLEGRPTTIIEGGHRGRASRAGGFDRAVWPKNC